MKLLIKDVSGLLLPSRATAKDACYDVIATTEPMIVGVKFNRLIDLPELWSRVVYIEYGTNLFVAPQADLQREIDNFNADTSGALCGVIWKQQNIDYHTLGYPRSSISKTNLMLANSVATIDNEYRGEIKLRFKYIFQPEDLVVVPEAGGTRVYGHVNMEQIYKRGDKIIQIKGCANMNIDFELVKELDVTCRNDGGFGSSGR